MDGTLFTYMQIEKARKSYLIMGMKHCGKSTLGAMLAANLKARHVDLDDRIEMEYRADRLVSCREIYRQHGGDFFKEMETTASRRLAVEIESIFSVVSLSGGIIENSTAVEAMTANGIFVYLVMDAQTLFSRISKGGIPPFLSKSDPYKDFLALFERRSRLMSGLAELTVKLENNPVELSFQSLLSAVVEHKYAG